MNHFAPHKWARFEGYYSKFVLPSSSSLILIVCSVHNAEERPHMVSMTYIPSDRMRPIYQKELFVPKGMMRFTASRNRDRFELEIPDLCSVKVHPDSTTEYVVSCPEYTFRAVTSTRLPWSPEDKSSTPESMLVYLPLPLHWHVHSLCGKAKFSFSMTNDSILDPHDSEGWATLHQEKNWAISFPSAHIWLQACPSIVHQDQRPEHTLALAGGHILGMQAYLIGYRNLREGIQLDFRPPFALQIFGMSPFLSTKILYATRSVEITVQNLTRKLRVRALVEKEDWNRSFGISAPFSDGHRQNALAQNLCAKVEIGVWKWSGSWMWGSWKKLLDDGFDQAALEFGAGWYGDRGGDTNLGVAEIKTNNK